MRRCGGRATRSAFVGSIALAALSLGSAAHAGEPDATALSRAHDAYARGAAAYAQGDYARAARELALADELVPAAVTLRAALDAVTLADDPVLGAALIARARVEPHDDAVERAALVAERRFTHRTGAVVIRCADCLATVDGEPATPGAARIVLPGVHSVTLQRGPSLETRLVSVAVDHTVDVGDDARTPASATIPAGGAPSDAVHASPSGASPAWFFAAAGVTVALGVAAVASAVQTASDHSSFVGGDCSVRGSSGCSATASAGESAETRTDVFLLATAVALSGTSVLGAFGTAWRRPSVAVTAAVVGPSAVLRATF